MPPISWQTIADTTATLTFTAISPTMGMMAVAATSSGYTPDLSLGGPLNGLVTVDGAQVTGAEVGALVRISASGSQGQSLAGCFTMVGRAGAITIPDDCRVPMHAFSIGVAIPDRGQIGPSAVATGEAQAGLPTNLPQTGWAGRRIDLPNPVRWRRGTRWFVTPAMQTPQWW